MADIPLPKDFIVAGKRVFRRSDVEMYKAQVAAAALGEPVKKPKDLDHEEFIPVKQFAAEIGASRRYIFKLFTAAKANAR